MSYWIYRILWACRITFRHLAKAGILKHKLIKWSKNFS